MLRLHLHTLKAFRQEVFACFLQAKDALFETVDALLTEDRARSFPELSLSPHFQRRWPSLYEAVEDGRIDEARLRQVFAAHLPPLPDGQDRWIGIDVSVIARSRARTSADRSCVPVHNLPHGEKVTTPGWEFSTVVALPESPSSWTYALAAQRVSTETTATQVALEQLQHLAVVLPANTITALDHGYDSTWLWCQCSTLPFMGYVRRFSQEHGSRFDKQALLWDKPRVRTPEQFERWTHLVAITRNHLVLARELVEAELRPWESVHRPPTPQQVRRGINTLLPQLGTPARPPQPRGKSPGRTKGTKVRKAKRFAVVTKRPKLPKLIPT